MTTTARRRLIRCRTDWCRAPLGETDRIGGVQWFVPIRHDRLALVVVVACPVCGEAREWRPRPRRADAKAVGEEGKTEHAAKCIQG